MPWCTMMLHNKIEDRLVFNKIQKGNYTRVSDDTEDVCFERDEPFDTRLTIDRL